MRPLVTFVAIVKNESLNFRKTLESVLPHVERAVVLDTGSTDGTQDLVREMTSGVPGGLYEEPFVDFATSRNRVLELAGEESVFTISLSGDETLIGGSELRAYLDAHREEADGGYLVEVRNRLKRWLYPRVLRSSAGWRYVGDVHEIPESTDHVRNGPTIPGIAIYHDDSDTPKQFRRLREYDLPRLTVRAGREDRPEEERAQAIWHLAQTHDALANEYPPHVPGGPWVAHKLQAMVLYQKRAEIAGDDRVFFGYAWLTALIVADQLGFIYQPREFIARLSLIIDANPHLPEAYLLLAKKHDDARKGLALAEKAADVAREVREAIRAGDQRFYLPMNEESEKIALCAAIDCARALHSENRVRELVKRARAAGVSDEVLG